MSLYELDGCFVDDRRFTAPVKRRVVDIPDAAFPSPTVTVPMPSTTTSTSSFLSSSQLPPTEALERMGQASSERAQRGSPTGGNVRRYPSAVWSLEVGVVIDNKYQLVERVGTGGFADVYRAMHKVLRTRVALKILKPSVVRERPDAVAMFCDEARIAAGISHHNVVRVFDITRIDDLVFLVMEFIEGVTLSELMSLHEQRYGTARIPESLVLIIAEGICRGLQAAEGHGVIHRDIKPSNIMIECGLGGAGRLDTILAGVGIVPKLVDLGLARLAGEQGLTGTASDVIGTPLYMPPEQVMAPGKVDQRSDLYALGCTLFHLLSGRTPYEGRSANDIIRAHLHDPLPNLRRMGCSVSDKTAQLVEAMMAKEQNRRPASYEDVLARIRAIRNDESGSHISTLFRKITGF
jgi:serine/threonine-protein kinase